MDRKCSFYLFLVFDVLVTLLFWLVYLVSKNPGCLDTSIIDEIVKYNIHLSFFDFVALVFLRAAILAVYYGYFDADSLWICGILTIGSCIFIFSKIFMMSWYELNFPVDGYYIAALCLVSFLLPWLEFWLLGSKFICKDVFIRISDHSRLLQEILNTHAPHLGSSDNSALVEGSPDSRRSSASVEFYSPVRSPTPASSK